MWDRIVQTLASEFADVADAEQTTRILVRLLLAALLGGVLGYERETKGKAAGIRTHMLVAMGSALFMLVPQLGGMELGDMSRVMQGVVAGIGFLGAGAIIKSSNEESVQGLTTAAGVWMTAAIGIACGLGRETTALLSTALALGVLALLPRLVPDKSDAAPQQGGAARGRAGNNDGNNNHNNNDGEDGDGTGTGKSNATE